MYIHIHTCVYIYIYILGPHIPYREISKVKYAARVDDTFCAREGSFDRDVAPLQNELCNGHHTGYVHVDVIAVIAMRYRCDANARVKCMCCWFDAKSM